MTDISLSWRISPDLITVFTVSTAKARGLSTNLPPHFCVFEELLARRNFSQREKSTHLCNIQLTQVLSRHPFLSHVHDCLCSLCNWGLIPLAISFAPTNILGGCTALFPGCRNPVTLCATNVCVCVGVLHNNLSRQEATW